MVPTRMDTRRERTPDGKSFRDGAPWPPTRRGISPERSVVPLLSTTSRSTPRSSTFNNINNKNSSSTSSHKSRSPLSSTKKLNLPLDVRATLGQNKARERVRQRVRQEKLVVQQKLADKKQIVARKQQVCDTVSLTNKMKKSTNKRRLKKTERAAKEAKELLAIQNASSLEDLLRERLTSRTTFGELLRCVRTETTPNGVTSARKFISTLHLTKVIFETIGLKLPLLTAENMMENIRQIQNQEQRKSTAATTTTFSQSSSTTKRGGKKKRKSRKSKKKINSSNTDVNIESKQIDQEFNLLKSKSSSSKKVSTSACETYFRRVRCAHRIEFNAWETEKFGETEKEMKVLHTTVARALKGDAVSLRRLIQEMQSLETSARLVLGEDPKSVEDIMVGNMSSTSNTSNMSNMNTTNGTSTTKSSNGKKPSRKTTRVRRELRKHNVLPKWQVESEAEKITSVWLLSLEGRAAVRHAAWAAVNRGRASSEASEPDQPALQAASQTLKTQRLEKLLGTTTDDNDTEGNKGKEGNGSNSTDSKNPFYEMLSHKLFGEYLRETLMSADEWKKSNLLGGVISAGKFPRRPFSEWLEKRNEQEKRNRETVEQWRRHKRRQLSSRAASTIKVATVTSVVEELRLLESNGFTEVKEKGGLGKMRVSARQGIRYLEKIKRIKDFGKENVANAFSQNDSSSSSSSLKQQRGSEIDSSNTTVLWISFQQFLQVMETSLFSLKAYSATQHAADQLLNGNKEDGTKLFIEDISLIEDGTTKIPKVFNENHLQEKMYERQEAYDLWKEKKDSELLKALELKEKKINKKFAKKNKLAKKSKKAVLKWKQGIKARKKTKKFQPRTAWQDVVEPGLDDDDDIDDM